MVNGTDKINDFDENYKTTLECNGMRGSKNPNENDDNDENNNFDNKNCWVQ